MRSHSQQGLLSNCVCALALLGPVSACQPRPATTAPESAGMDTALAEATKTGSVGSTVQEPTRSTTPVATGTALSPTPEAYHPSDWKAIVIALDSLFRLDFHCEGLPLSCAATVTKLTEKAAVYTSAVWSPDGRQIAFARTDGDAYGMYADGIFIIDESGGDFNHISLTGDEPDWSNDGKLIAYRTNRDLIGIIQLGVGARDLPFEGDACCPLWSPDDTLIAFEGGDPIYPDLYVMSPAGDNLRLVDRNTAYPFEWSPDGRYLVYPLGRNVADLYVADMSAELNTPRRVRLTDSGHGALPAWSPNGMHILFVSETSGDSMVYIVDTTCIAAGSDCGQRARPIFSVATHIAAAAWLPDGRTIALSMGGQQDGRVLFIDSVSLAELAAVHGLEVPRDLVGFPN